MHTQAHVNKDRSMKLHRQQAPTCESLRTTWSFAEHKAYWDKFRPGFLLMHHTGFKKRNVPLILNAPGFARRHLGFMHSSTSTFSCDSSHIITYVSSYVHRALHTLQLTWRVSWWYSISDFGLLHCLLNLSLSFCRLTYCLTSPVSLILSSPLSYFNVHYKMSCNTSSAATHAMSISELCIMRNIHCKHATEHIKRKHTHTSVQLPDYTHTSFVWVCSAAHAHRNCYWANEPANPPSVDVSLTV